MSLRESTQRRFASLIEGRDDLALVGCYYNPEWTIPCVCGHPIKTVFVVGHANDHGPAFSLPTFNIGSECIKLFTVDPKFMKLSQDLQAKNKEIKKIQLQERHLREDAVHISAEWKKIWARLLELHPILQLVRYGGFNYLFLIGIDVKTFPSFVQYRATECAADISKINRGEKRFQNIEDARELLRKSEKAAVETIDTLTPDKFLLESFVAKHHSQKCIPGVCECIVTLERMSDGH